MDSMLRTCSGRIIFCCHQRIWSSKCYLFDIKLTFFASWVSWVSKNWKEFEWLCAITFTMQIKSNFSLLIPNSNFVKYPSRASQLESPNSRQKLKNWHPKSMQKYPIYSRRPILWQNKKSKSGSPKFCSTKMKNERWIEFFSLKLFSLHLFLTWILTSC